MTESSSFRGPRPMPARDPAHAPDPARGRRRAGLAASLALVALAAGCGSGGGDAPAELSSAERLQIGRALFDAQCLACHADASGTQVRTTGTSLVRARNEPAVIAAAIAANVGGMGRLANLSTDDLANIALYLGQAIPGPTAGPSPAPAPAPAPAPGQPPGPPGSRDVVNNTARGVQVASGLSSPWGGAVLPDGRMLVTQRAAGSFVIVNLATGRIDATVNPGLASEDEGQGGLLDVVLDPGHASNQLVYWTFAERSTTNNSTGTAVARGRLVGAALQDVRVIYRQTPKAFSSIHFGSRLAFANDGTLFVTLGDRGQDNPDNPTGNFAQSAATGYGKVVRINTDGTPAAGNPNFGAGAQAGLWSLGHRNPQGAAIHPATGELWVSEHGAQGGDEINIARAGGNFGWPFVSYGCNYGGPSTCRVGGGTHAPRFTEPLTTWIPQSVAPSGIAFTPAGGRYPGWENSVFMGAMSGIAGGQSVWRLSLASNTVSAREYLLRSLNERIRDVVPSPDGWLYLLTDSGRILRLEQR
jgi:aldose sugar dehydrogenase